MQQPWLMGDTAAKALIDHIEGRETPKEVLVEVMIATSTNIEEILPEARKTVFGETM
jgi:ribose transport system substrate-binding protein